MTKQLSLRVGSTIIVLNQIFPKETRHIRAIVDNKKVIYRIWVGGGWKYAVDSIEELQQLYNDGLLKHRGKSKSTSNKIRRSKFKRR